MALYDELNKKRAEAQESSLRSVFGFGQSNSDFDIMSPETYLRGQVSPQEQALGEVNALYNQGKPREALAMSDKALEEAPPSPLIPSAVMNFFGHDRAQPAAPASPAETKAPLEGSEGISRVGGDQRNAQGERLGTPLYTDFSKGGRVSTIQTSDVAARERDALAQAIRGAGAEGDLERVRQLSGGVMSPEIQKARADALAAGRQEADIQSIGSPLRRAAARIAQGRNPNAQGLTAYQAATLQGQAQDRALKAAQLGVTTQKQAEEAQSREATAQGTRNKALMDRFTNEMGGDKQRAAKLMNDIGEGLTASHQRLSKAISDAGGDVDKLSKDDRDWATSFTKLEGGKRVPKNVGDLTETELDRFRGASLMRKALENSKALTSGLGMVQNWVTYFNGPDGELSSDLSKFDTKRFKQVGDYIVGSGPAKGIRIPVRDLQRLDENGEPIAQSVLGAAFGGFGGQRSTGLYDRIGR